MIYEVLIGYCFRYGMRNTYASKETLRSLLFCPADNPC